MNASVGSAGLQPTRARRVTIAQFDPGGHRLVYVRLLAEQALDRGDRVTLALGFDPRQSKHFALHLGHLGDRVEITGLRSGSLRHLKRAARFSRADHTVVPDGDRVAIRMGLPGRWWGQGTVSSLVMRDPALQLQDSVAALPAQRKVLLSIKRGLLSRADRGRSRVYRLAGGGGTADPPPGYVADPVSVQDDPATQLRLRQDWGLTSDRCWFAVVGAVTRRKNLPLVAQALSALDAERVGLLVAGGSSDDARTVAAPALATLRSTGAAVVDVDRLLSEEELDAIVRTVDALVLAHSNEGPSGILGKALVARTRVIAAGALSLHHDVAGVEGAEWVSLDLDELSGACRRLLENWTDSHGGNEQVASGTTGQDGFFRLLDSR